MRGHWSLRAALGKRQNRLVAIMAIYIASLGTLKIYEHSNRTDADAVLKNVVAIGEASGKLYGSGVVMDGGEYVLTVNHVVEGMLNEKHAVLVTYRDGSSDVATVIRRNSHFDIALLRMHYAHENGLRLVSDKTVHQGDHVRAAGHPFGITWMITDGIISKKSYFPPNSSGDMFVLWTTAFIEGGNSGGPLVNDNGEIVGLVMAFMNPRGAIIGASHLNLCVSGSEILRFLENP